MNQIAVKEKVLSLEAELGFIKKLVSGKPDFSIDEKIWKETKLESKKARKNLYKSRYGKK